VLSEHEGKGGKKSESGEEERKGSDEVGEVGIGGDNGSDESDWVAKVLRVEERRFLWII